MNQSVSRFVDLLDINTGNIPPSLSGDSLKIPQVNASSTGIDLVSPSAVIAPIIGTVPLDHIAIGGNNPPLLKDSGIVAGHIPPPFFPMVTGQYIDMDISDPLGQLIAFDDVNKAFVMGANISGMGQDADLVFLNNSVGARNIQIANGSTGDVDLYADSGAVNISEGINNNSMSLDSGGLQVNYNGSGSSLALNSFGFGLNVPNPFEVIQLSAASGSTLNLSGGISALQGNFQVLLNQPVQGHFISLGNPSGIVIAANSAQDLGLNTDGNLHIKANSSTGSIGQVLTADGSTNAKWQTPPAQNICMSSINAVPAGAAWIATVNDFIPYDDGVAGYGGFQYQTGSSISYNNGTHLFTIADDGVYNVMVVQNVNINNSLGFVKTDGRLALFSSPALTQMNQDSGRFETTLAQSAAGILSLNYQLNVVAFLAAGDYGIYVIGEPEGALLGKGSCVFTRVT